MILTCQFIYKPGGKAVNRFCKARMFHREVGHFLSREDGHSWKRERMRTSKRVKFDVIQGTVGN